MFFNVNLAVIVDSNLLNILSKGIVHYVFFGLVRYITIILDYFDNLEYTKLLTILDCSFYINHLNSPFMQSFNFYSIIKLLTKLQMNP